MPPTLQPVPIPILIEVLAHIPTDFFHCYHCEQIFGAVELGAAVRRETRTTYPPEMLKDAERLATWLADLSARYGERLHVRIIDPQSMEGFLKSLRYWVRRYPTFIINRRTKYTGWESAALERLLADRIINGRGV
jgi:hypothetical protein